MCVFIGSATWAKVKQAAIAQEVVDIYVAQNPGEEFKERHEGGYVEMGMYVPGVGQRYYGGGYSRHDALRHLAAQILERNPNTLAHRTALETFALTDDGGEHARAMRDLVNV